MTNVKFAGFKIDTIHRKVYAEFMAYTGSFIDSEIEHVTCEVEKHGLVVADKYKKIKRELVNSFNYNKHKLREKFISKKTRNTFEFLGFEMMEETPVVKVLYKKEDRVVRLKFRSVKESKWLTDEERESLKELIKFFKDIFFKDIDKKYHNFYSWYIQKVNKNTLGRKDIVPFHKGVYA